MRRRYAALTTLLLSLLLGAALAACRGSGEATAVPQQGNAPGDGTTVPVNDSTVVAAAPFSATEACPYGGIHVDWGIDSNGNGALDPDEVDNSGDICNGAPGASGSAGDTTLIATRTEPAGANCATGGIRIQAGPDVSRDGILQPGEVMVNAYVCNGAEGLSGAPGGMSLIKLTPEPPGTNCVFGGTKVESGIDDNGNLVLDPGEVESTAYVCTARLDTSLLDGLFFTADKEAEVVDLWRASLDGTAVGRLSDPDAIGDVLDFKVSPDGERVAYRQAVDAGIVELFVVDFSLGARRFKVSAPPEHPSVDVEFDYAWSPNGADLAFRQDARIDQAYDLYVYQSSRRATRRDTSADALESVFGLKWSPDGNQIAFVADLDGSGVHDLWSIDYTAASPTASRRTALSSTGGVVFFAWTPSSSAIAYMAKAALFAATELYAVPTGSTVSTKLSGPLTAGGNVVYFEFSPNGEYIAYRADAFVDNQFELFTTRPPPFSATILRVSGSMVANGNMLDFAWAPDSSRLAFRADRLTQGVAQLFTVAPASTVPVTVSGSQNPNGDVFQFAWAPDASRIAFRADRITDNKFELWTVLPTSTFPVRVSGPTMAGDVSRFAWAPDSSRIAYSADQVLLGQIELFTTHPAGAAGGNVAVYTTPLAGGDVFQLLWRPDSSAIAGTAYHEVLGRIEAIVAVPDGSGSRKVSGAMTNPAGDVFDMAW